MNFLIKRFYILLFGLTPLVAISQQPINSFYHGNGWVGKPPIDTSVLEKWPMLEDKVHISNDGKYFIYFIRNQPIGQTTCVVQSTSTKWKKAYENIKDAFFTNDSRKIVICKKEVLYFLDLGTDYITNIKGVKYYATPKMNSGKWIAYQINDSLNQLTLHNLMTDKKLQFSDVVDYKFEESGQSILLLREFKNGSYSKIDLSWLDLEANKQTVIWSYQDTDSSKAHLPLYCSDFKKSQISFFVEENINGITKNSIWYYEVGKSEAEMKVCDDSLYQQKGLIIDKSDISLSKNGRWIFFNFKGKPESYKPDPNVSLVDVWSYKDVVLNPQQRVSLARGGSQRFLAAISVVGNKVIQVENENEMSVVGSNLITGDYVVIKDNNSNQNYWWTISPQPSFYLMSLIDGSRAIIKKEAGFFGLENITFSPEGKFLIYFDVERKSYVSYDINRRKEINLSKEIPTSIISKIYGLTRAMPISSIAGWLESDKALFIYDDYDIWQIDPQGIIRPKNVSNGYGLKHKLILRFSEDVVGDYGQLVMKVINDNAPKILTAFNTENKNNGFYKITGNVKKDPEKLVMGANIFYLTESQKASPYSFGDGMIPLKAKNAYIWIIQRISPTDAPNLFSTTDFKSYHRLTDIQPQKNYNWITVELVSWKQFDGTISQGILYKPENFDSTKKYPVIFNYYEKMSHRLYGFPYPRFTKENINIPWFVSNGYLVFTPDIHFSVAKISGKTVGEYAYNSVVSAAKILSKRSYIDSKRMGLQGHSFGGLLTAFLATHTSLFVAAAEVAGSTDPISAYLTLVPFVSNIEHKSKQINMELGHELYGATPWERPDLYRKNSAVLSADKTTTPLLIMHNMRDNQVQWRQGVEFFMALRRLGKKAWMLQYDNGSHYVGGKDAIDYTIRLTQFFDYYLRGALPPKWMTEGIPAEYKGVISKYEYDKSGKKP